MRVKPISWRTVVFATSLIVMAGGGYAFTSAVHADRSKSQDPRAWDDGNGHLDESRVPDRIAMSSGDVASGVVYIDPHQFYGELGARTDEGPVPVYDQRDGGQQVGTFDLRTGDISIDLSYSRHDSRPAAVSRTRTTVAEPPGAAPGNSSPPTTGTGDTTASTDTTVITVTGDTAAVVESTVPAGTTPTSDPAVTVGTASTASTQP
jgi:hypothetical protein